MSKNWKGGLDQYGPERFCRLIWSQSEKMWEWKVLMQVMHLFVYSLGKTIQVIGFLSGLFDADKIKTVLIVAPVGVIVNWINEFEKW